MNAKSDRRTDRQTDISTGNSISPKSMESSTSCLSLVDETSCLINCCRCLLPDAQWWKNAYTHVSEVQIIGATTYTMDICNHTLTHCRLNRIFFVLMGKITQHVGSFAPPYLISFPDLTCSKASVAKKQCGYCSGTLTLC